MDCLRNRNIISHIFENNATKIQRLLGDLNRCIGYVKIVDVKSAAKIMGRGGE